MINEKLHVYERANSLKQESPNLGSVSECSRAEKASLRRFQRESGLVVVISTTE